LHACDGQRIDGARRIAVLRAGALGDFVFALPALDALRGAYPGAELVLLAKAWTASLLHERPSAVDRVIVVPTVRGVGAPPDAGEDAAALAAFFTRMRAERFDVALQLHGGGRHSNPFVTMLGARVTAGMRATDAPPLDRTLPYLYHQNERLRLLEAVALVGAAPRTLVPHLVVTARDRAEADAIVPACAAPLVVLQPGATDPRRRWPPDRFARLGDALIEAGALVAINGSAAEAALVREVRAAMRGAAVDLAGRLSLAGLAGLLSRAKVVVSNDTGPLFLAEAVGAATVGIYWLLNLAQDGPLFRARHRYALSTRIACPQCGRPQIDERCEHDASFVADVGVDQVLIPALELLHEPRENAG
jgi:ADP-heptose:LPS heptosyltransferase